MTHTCKYPSRWRPPKYSDSNGLLSSRLTGAAHTPLYHPAGSIEIQTAILFYLPPLHSCCLFQIQVYFSSPCLLHCMYVILFIHSPAHEQIFMYPTLIIQYALSQHSCMNTHYSSLTPGTVSDAQFFRAVDSILVVEFNSRHWVDHCTEAPMLPVYIFQ